MAADPLIQAVGADDNMRDLVFYSLYFRSYDGDAIQVKRYSGTRRMPGDRLHRVTAT